MYAFKGFKLFKACQINSFRIGTTNVFYIVFRRKFVANFN